MAYRVPFLRCLLILTLCRPILASPEDRESCTLEIFVGSYLAVRCEGPEKIDKTVDWLTKQPSSPIDIAPGIQLFGEIEDTGQRALLHIENRTLELSGLILMANDLLKAWNVQSPISMVNSTIWLVDSTIYSASATSISGGLFVSESHLYVDRCSFNGNPDSEDENEAGIIRATNASSVDIRNSSFRDIASAAAAIYVDGKSHLDISTISVERTRGKRSSAIYATDDSSVRIENSSFSNCESTKTGAVTIENGKKVEIYACNFMLNTGKNGAAVRVTSPSTVGDRNDSAKGTTMLRVSDSVFQTNSAKENGGALYVFGADLEMTHTQILGNKATDRGAGLAVFEANRAVVTSSSFEDQFFQNSEGAWHEQTGGGIYAELVKSFRLSHCRLIGNRALKKGGGGYFLSLLKLEIKNNTITANHAREEAGLGVKGVENVTVIGMTVTNNHATSFAAGMSFLETMDLTVRNSVFEKNEAPNVGAMSAMSATNVRMDRCTFKGNQATGGGAGALKLVAALNVNITRTNVFSNNAKGEAAGILAESVDVMTIDASTFTRNTAHTGASCLIRLAKAVHIIDSHFIHGLAEEGGGGALYIDQIDRAFVQNSDFSFNQAQGDGGAFFISTTPRLSFIQTQFKNNNSTMGSAGAFAAKSMDNVFLRGCRFYQNRAFRDGGAVSLVSVYNELEIADSDFAENEATGRGESQGGAIALFLFSKMNVEHSEFRNNKASLNGGALSLPGTKRELSRTLVMTQNTFISNEADTGSGGALYFEKSPHLELNHVRFESNRASLTGGAILVQKGQHVVFSETYLGDNRLKKSEAAAEDIYERSRQGKAHPPETGGFQSDEKDSNNSVWKHPNRIKNGGAIALIEIENTSLFGVKLEANTAPGSGGAAFIQDSKSVVSDGTQFFDNEAWTMGGGLFLNRVQAITIDASEFTYNRVSRKDSDENYRDSFEQNGGALVIKRSQNVHLNRVVYSQNQAKDSGGAISFDTVSLLDARDCQFAHNRAHNGGAVHVVKSSEGSIDRCSFSENIAGCQLTEPLNIAPQNATQKNVTNQAVEGDGHGGAMFLEDSQQFNITAPKFLSNLAHGHGGALHCARSGNLTLSHSRFLNNSALHTGGAISVNAANLTLSINQFTRNHAVNGSFLSVSGGIVNGTGLQTYQNMADEHGGLIYCTEPSNISLATSKFVDDGSHQGDSFMAECSCHVAILESKIVCSNNDVSGCGMVKPDAQCDSAITLETANVIYYNKFWSIFKLIAPALVSVPLLILIARFCMLLWTGTAKKLGLWKEMEEEPLIDGYPDIWGPLDDSANNRGHHHHYHSIHLNDLHVYNDNTLTENGPSSPTTLRSSLFHRSTPAIGYAPPVDSVQSMMLQSHQLLLEDDLIGSPEAIGPDTKNMDFSSDLDASKEAASHIKRDGIVDHSFYVPVLKEHRITVDDTPSSPEDRRRRTCHTIYEQQDFKFEYDQMAETRFESSIFD